MPRSLYRILGLTLGLFATLLFESAMAAGQNPDLIQRGRYLARMGDCIACHTRRGGEPYAGGRGIGTPFGVIYTPNITPDKETGIGDWSEEEFYEAMHNGISPGWKHLYPAFPFPSFTHVTRKDVRAIHAYLSSLDPVHYKAPVNELPWPFSWRLSMIGWRILFFDEGEYQPNPQRSDQWNRGAYLVEGLAHCTACHTPRDMLGGKIGDRKLAGGAFQNWYAPNLTSNKKHGLGDWTVDEIAQFLKTGGVHGKTAAMGPMKEVVHDSLQHAKLEDLEAIAVYLKSQPTRPIAPDPQIGDSSEMKIEADQLDYIGQQVYATHCDTCHMPSGKGIPGAYPPLAGNPVVNTNNPVNALRMVLDGGFRAATESDPMPYSMPPFGDKLSDREIAGVLTYIRGNWGNDASAVSEDDVQTLH